MARSRSGSPDPGAPTFAFLPQVVHEQMLSFMPLLDAARAACACKALRLAAAAAAARVQRLACAADWGVEQPSVDAVAYAAKRCTRLQVVWLGASAFDDHLFALRRAPALSEVLMAGSDCTDAGVAALLEEVPCLALIDAVECAHVTEASARLAAGRVVIRRLPAWFSRGWRCVEHRTIPVGEVHRYAPDGSFRFTREQQNSGFVVSWRAAPAPADGGDAPGHFQFVVRFDDEAALALIGLPNWRPGICVKAEGDRMMRSAQRRGGADNSAPDTLPLVDAAGIVCGLWAAEDEEKDAHDAAPAGADEQR